MGIKHYKLSDAQWHRIERMLPGKVTDPSRTDLPPESWTVLSLKIPVMIGGPGDGVSDEADQVFGGADRLRAEAG